MFNSFALHSLHVPMRRLVPIPACGMGAGEMVAGKVLCAGQVWVRGWCETSAMGAP